MGCQPSNTVGVNGPEIKITIIDSAFMKPQFDQIRKDMQDNNIKFQCFISMECFLDEFSKRYYNKVVTSLQNYAELKNVLDGMGLSPKIFVTLNGKPMTVPQSANTISVQNYAHLIKVLRQNGSGSIKIQSLQIGLPRGNKMVDVKIFSKPGPRSSEQTIFEAVLKKSSITYQFYNNFQQLEQSLHMSQSKYVVTEHRFHKQVVQLFKATKTLIICYCSLDKNQTYSPELYFISDNYLDITNQLKNQLKSNQKNNVKCSKVYLYVDGLQDVPDVKATIQSFDIEVREFSNFQKVIRDTTYFFCVTVLAVESQIKNLSKYFQRNNYLQKTKLISIPRTAQPTIKGLNKIIRNIKKGYCIKKGITSSIDIIDKHYNSTKFEQIKKQLENNNIKCFGYSNISQYIKNKKFISSFIICNYEERSLVVKYMKQLECKAKVVVFCNKNKIDADIKNCKNFAFVSSHFGKIIKYIKKTHVFMPSVAHQEDQLFKDKIDKIKSKNKRISAIKWSQISEDQKTDEKQENFQFLNIAKDTNNGSIRDIQKSVATIWKSQTSITDLGNFKKNLSKSLSQLRKYHKINSSETQFNQLLQLIKQSTFSQLLQKVKTFFDSDNELGLQINKSLMRTETLDKKQITNMRQFLLLVFMNFYSGFHIPKISRNKITHWISNSLIQKCQIGSYLFSKHFLMFYLNSDQNVGDIGKYKMEVELEYNSLSQADLMLNSYINYRDKVIFAPFSQFQIQGIDNCGSFKVIRLKYVKNVDFLKYIYQQNLITPGKNIEEIKNIMQKPDCQLVDSTIRQQFNNNIDRLKAIEQFQKGDLKQSIQIHKRLIKQNQQKQNLDSVLVNQLNFELACFYFKGEMNRDAGSIINQVLDAAPGDFIKQECQKMIKQVVEEDNNEENSKKRRISEQAMKTFVWLKNKQISQQNDDGNSGSELSGNEENEHEINIFEKDMNCMQIEDIEEFKQISCHKIEKQNIETQ